ncbi:MAG: hypothetical protein DME24_11835 [Verrucomicrobia bacterium]|nr:MAG: hypothetical protein DME24_11835 [Verrucomicrobiota bacterium]
MAFCSLSRFASISSLMDSATVRANLISSRATLPSHLLLRELLPRNWTAPVLKTMGEKQWKSV